MGRTALSSYYSNQDHASTFEAPFIVIFLGWERNPIIPHIKWRVTMRYHWTFAYYLLKCTRKHNKNPPDRPFSSYTHSRYLYSERRKSIFSKKNLTNLTNEQKLNNGTDGDVYLTTTSQRYGMEDCLKFPIPPKARFYFYLSNVHDTVHD